MRTPELRKCLYRVARSFQIHDERAFGNFCFKAMRRQPRVTQNGKNLIGKISVTELRRRKIER